MCACVLLVIELIVVFRLNLLSFDNSAKAKFWVQLVRILKALCSSLNSCVPL